MSHILARVREGASSITGPCDLCRDVDALLVSASPHGAMSFGLCADCIKMGLDPLDPKLLEKARTIIAKGNQILKGR